MKIASGGKVTTYVIIRRNRFVVCKKLKERDIYIYKIPMKIEKNIYTLLKDDVFPLRHI